MTLFYHDLCYYDCLNSPYKLDTWWLTLKFEVSVGTKLIKFALSS